MTAAARRRARPGPPRAEAFTLRPARPRDVSRLDELERTAFASDRLAPRNFRHLVASASADVIVAEAGDALAGYAIVLRKRGAPLARLYSLAVDRRHRRLGLGRRLVEAVEAAAREAYVVFMRTEVAVDNPAGLALMHGMGYEDLEKVEDYYDDGADALRLEKSVWRGEARFETRHPVPFYAQTTSFTCGPAALMMAMAAIDPARPMTRAEELEIWREATTIYMTSGHGGCSPHGLALAAWRRGFDVDLFVSRRGPLFLDGVRSAEKKAVLELVHDTFREKLEDTDVRLHRGRLTRRELTRLVQAGAVPIVLITAWSFTRERAPHWVAVSGIDDAHVYLHDPDVDDPLASSMEQRHIPVPLEAFERISKFGRAQLRAALVLKERLA